MVDGKLVICMKCPHSVHKLGVTWCGTPVVGTILRGENGSEVKLCGCAMDVKLRAFPRTACPDGRFDSRVECPHHPGTWLAPSDVCDKCLIETKES